MQDLRVYVEGKEPYTAAGVGCSNTSLESFNTGFFLPANKQNNVRERFAFTMLVSLKCEHFIEHFKTFKDQKGCSFAAVY